ncbi:putative Nuclear pore complex protein Nup205 [Hypsibius exemplaris]|uniref:Nuclear pore complex protein Nup205 n=1 Tax=Hypsibius exemplaris TaxID=2072580 RepID=A0A9X6RK49_HYPEX|nr:putative Nuclear pore complex protein Nup205 [Hypsibius exemplaris]
MARPSGILRQDSRNRRLSPSDRLSSDDPQADTLLRLLRRVGEEQQPETSAITETLRQVAQSINNENLAKVVNNYLRSRRSRLLSYDNFFRALAGFHEKLNRGSGSSHGWRMRPASEPEECTPADFDTFDALIEIVGKIAEYDEHARVQIANNPELDHPLQLLVVLVSCAIPTTMKATVLRTLAAFAKPSQSSVGTAVAIWQYMGHILETLTVTGPMQGLKQEMEDVEVKFREYPVTKAIILLISRIFEGVTSQSMAPEILQQFQDFTNYVYEAVFLKADLRSFSTPQEHLDVLIACLTLFEKSLKSLNDMSLIFVPAMTSHPGYVLRQRVLEGREFFDKLTNWLTVSIEELGKKHGDIVRQRLEDVVQCILSIFKCVICRHDEFLKILHQNDRNAEATSLDALIAQKVNARTGRKDLLFVFMRILKFRTTRLPIAQNAMEITDFVTRRVDDQRDWITLLYFDEALCREVSSSFYDCMQVDPMQEPDANQSFETSESMKLLQQTLRVLLGNLKQCSFPNMAHVLLGFPVRNGYVEPALGPEAGSSSLGRLLELVEPGKSLYEILPTTTELALDILDNLCQHQKTGRVILDFIRSTWTGDLTVRGMVEQVPLVVPGDSGTFKFLRHQKALLHIIAKEIRLLAEEYKIQSALDLISMLGNFPRGPDAAPLVTSVFATPASPSGMPQEPLLIRLFSIADVEIPSLEPVRNLALELLEVANVEDALNAAKIPTEDGLLLHDASETLLYIRELLHVHEENGMGRSDVVQDFKTVCDYIEREAFLVGLVRARRECFEAWSILVGTVAESCPADAFAYPIVPSFFLDLSGLLASKLQFGVPSADAFQVFETLFSTVTAFVRFTGPPKFSMSILEAFGTKGYAAECIKMDYKSVIVRTKNREMSSLIKNMAIIVLKPTTTIFNRRGYYAILLTLLKFADWQYENIEDASLAYTPSVQDAASSLRALVRDALADLIAPLIEVLQSDSASESGSDEGIIVQILSRLCALCQSHSVEFDLISSLVTGLPKDNQTLASCVMAQTDIVGALTNFETKFDILTAWLTNPASLPADPEEISCVFQTAIRAVLQFDVIRALPLIQDTKSSIASVQRAFITGTSYTVYGYCIVIFRKVVDLLITVLRQVRLRPAHRDAMFRVYRYIEKYGACFSDCLREPTDADDPAWDDICRTTELVSLVNHSYFIRELSNPESTDLSPEMLAIEMKLGRLLHNLGSLVVKAPNGNYSEYYSDLKRRSRSIQLVHDLVAYLRRLMFETGSAQVNLSVIRPVFARSQIVSRRELARGTVSVSYGDLLEHIRTFCGALTNRMKTLDNVRAAITHSNASVTETDLQAVLDSEYLPSRREDRQNFYKLFLKEQERDICVDLRQLLNIVENLIVILVIHLEYAFVQFIEEAEQEGSLLPPSMRRALLPSLEQSNPSRPLDSYYHFKSSVRDFITEDFVKLIQGVAQNIGEDSNTFLNLFVDRLTALVQESTS